MDQVTVLAQEGNQLTDILSFVLLLSCGNIGFIEIKCIFTAWYQDICPRTGFAGDVTLLCMEQEYEELNRWIEYYSRPLLNRALSLVEDKEDALDLVQEVFISAASALNTFEGKSAPLTWLQGILRNKVADFYRQRYRRPQTVSLSRFFDKSGSWTDESVLQEWPGGFNGQEGQSTLSDALEECLEALPARWQVIIKLYYLEDKKADEVCQESGITATNLWKVLQRSRMQLRKCLELNWFDKL